jgi:multiple sugar transport system permease protein
VGQLWQSCPNAALFIIPKVKTIASQSITRRFRSPKLFHWSSRAREALAGYLCTAPAVFGFLAFYLGPMLYSLYLSLCKADMLTTPEFVGLENYGNLFHEELWWKSMVNTAYFTFTSVFLSIWIGLLIAILLNQRVKLLGFFRVVYYLPSVVSGVAVALLWIWLFNTDYGLLNGFLGLFGIRGPSWLHSEEWAMPALILMSLWGVGGNTLIFLAGLQGIPESLYDAAKIDGAGTLQCFWHVTVPMMTPTIYFNLVLGIIGSFQVFTPAYLMTSGGPNNATLTQILYIYNQGFKAFHFGFASALAWVLFAVILLFVLMIFRSSQAWVYYESELRK